MKILEAKNLTKKYNRQEKNAVERVSLSLEKGQILGLVGESGCGKTTLLRLLGGLEDRDQGEIYIHGERLRNPSEILIPGHPQVKVVFQDFQLYPNHKIEENIAYPLRSYVEEYQQERVGELLKLCKIEELAKKYPRELSGGQKQRVALAVALADEPKLLLMDEPFSHLDSIHKNQLRAELRDIIRETVTTTILVSHDIQDILALADEIAVMRNGVFVQKDIPENIYNHPKNSYIAHLFGNANIVNGSFLHKIIRSLDEKQEACVRAEDIHIHTSSDTLWEGEVLQVDYLGAFSQIKIKTKENVILQVHTSQKNIQKKDRVCLHVDKTRIHFFEKEGNR